MSDAFSEHGPVVCRVCRTSLDVYDVDGVISYRHARPVVRRIGAHLDEHEPEPMTGFKPLDIIGVCDFCSEPYPRYSHVCKTFTVDGLPGATEYGSIEDWAACEACHELIQQQAWSALAMRSVQHAPPELRELVQNSVRSLHDGFRANRTGEVIDLMEIIGPR